MRRQVTVLIHVHLVEFGDQLPEQYGFFFLLSPPLIQLRIAVAGAVGAAVLAGGIESGPQVDAARTWNFLFAVGGGSSPWLRSCSPCCSLTVQFASTTLSPRLNMFRDDPLVCHAFALFVGVFVFATTAALRTTTREEMSVVVPTATIVLALAAMAVARNLQMSAFSSVQVGPPCRRSPAVAAR